MTQKAISKFILLACLGFNAAYGADGDAWAEINTPTTASSYQGDKMELLGLYKTEASNSESKIAKMIAELKKDNDGFTIESEISEDDVVKLNSTQAAGGNSTDYLLLVRGGHKSNITILKYLKAVVSTSDADADDNETVKVRILGSVKVTIR